MVFLMVTVKVLLVLLSPTLPPIKFVAGLMGLILCRPIVVNIHP